MIWYVNGKMLCLYTLPHSKRGIDSTACAALWRQESPQKNSEFNFVNEIIKLCQLLSQCDFIKFIKIIYEIYLPFNLIIFNIKNNLFYYKFIFTFSETIYQH